MFHCRWIKNKLSGMMDKKSEMKKIESEVCECKKCGLYKTRQLPVVGEGSLNADLLFIGEAPGYNEDLQGKPFAGRSGKVFDELLESIELKREKIYITNILKCRPPKNRNPLLSEIKSCTPYLDKQLGIIKPKIIVTLGNFATQYIFEKFGMAKKRISDVHGKTFPINTLNGNLVIIPIFHPACVVYNSNMMNILKADFQKIKNVLTN